MHRIALNGMVPPFQQDNSNGILIKDLLKYDEVPGITNCSTVSVPAGMVIDKHLHPSKVSSPV